MLAKSGPIYQPQGCGLMGSGRDPESINTGLWNLDSGFAPRRGAPE
jgi:hypothetical protein